jgi:hypothetical protein
MFIPIGARSHNGPSAGEVASVGPHALCALGAASTAASNAFGEPPSAASTGSSLISRHGSAPSCASSWKKPSAS